MTKKQEGNGHCLRHLSRYIILLYPRRDVMTLTFRLRFNLNWIKINFHVEKNAMLFPASSMLPHNAEDLSRPMKDT